MCDWTVIHMCLVLASIGWNCIHWDMPTVWPLNLFGDRPNTDSVFIVYEQLSWFSVCCSCKINCTSLQVGWLKVPTYLLWWTNKGIHNNDITALHHITNIIVTPQDACWQPSRCTTVTPQSTWLGTIRVYCDSSMCMKETQKGAELWPVRVHDSNPLGCIKETQLGTDMRLKWVYGCGPSVRQT